MLIRNLLLLAVCYLSTVSTFAQTTPGVWRGWESQSRDYIYAGVDNESKSRLAKACEKSTGFCFWVLFVETPCVEDRKQVVLASSRLGASALETTCSGKVPIEGNESYYGLIFEDDALLEKMISTGAIVGFVMALDGGDFKVSRFNCDGAANSIKTLAAAIERTKPRSKPTSIGDSKL